MSTSLLAVTLFGAIATAFAQTAVPASHRAFDVVSIKPNTSGVAGERIGPIMMGSFTGTNITVDHLLRLAYDVHEFEVLGAPEWTKSATFDITAKAEGMDKATYEEMRPLLQTLLADRFKLALHRETKDLPVYELVAAKDAPKLVATKEGSCTAFDPRNPPPPQPGGALPRICGATQMGKNLLRIVGSTLPDLAADLSELLGRSVIDKTGVTGRFDVDLRFAPDDAIAIGGLPSPTGDLSRPSIFAAVQEQLGLRLKSSKGPVHVLMIDHVERPTEN
jgi:uncharacterized protein (TIGR03435 family)